MESRKYRIDQIPAILYGAMSEKCFLYIHGKLGFKEEAELFAKNATARGWQVLSIDLPEHGERTQERDKFFPWYVVPELRTVLQYMQQRWTAVGLRANSIGAWFAMQSFSGLEFETCLFVSPILDMEKLIQDMMRWAVVSEERLKEELLIATDFGETLSWKYYEYAKEHPITKWQCQIQILYADKDHLTAQETVTGFVAKFHSIVTVITNGEHWFHTQEQLDALSKWEIDCMR